VNGPRVFRSPGGRPGGRVLPRPPHLWRGPSPPPQLHLRAATGGAAAFLLPLGGVKVTRYSRTYVSALTER